MAITKILAKNVVYEDGVELGIGSDGRKIRARFFDKTLMVFKDNADVNLREKSTKTLTRGYLIAQTFHGVGIENTSDWAPHPKEWYAADQMEGTTLVRTALKTEEVQYFATRQDFYDLGWIDKSNLGNVDPRHWGSAESRKEGEEAVKGLYFKIQDDGKPVRCDKDGKLLKNDSTYVNPDEDPKKITADDDTTTSTLWQKIKTNAKTIAIWVGGVLVVVVVGSWAYFKLFKKKVTKK